MSISERITGTIENWRKLWGEALKNFLVAILSFGMEIFFDILGKAFAPKLTPFINKLEETGKVPPELQPILDEIKNPKGQVAAMLAQSTGGAVVSGGLSRILDILFLPISYELNRTLPVRMPDETQLINLWLRGIVSPEDLERYLKELGDNPLAQLAFRELSQGRIDSMSWIIAFRRKYERFADIENDLRDQGWSPARIEALKFVTLYYPSPAELVNWQAKEVFEPVMREKYGLGAELEELEREAFYKAGMDDEQIANFWMAHWQHPAFREVTEMLHRGELTPEDVYSWYRLVEIPPYWRDKLTTISWDLPNRIELRMMARYGLVDKSFLLEQLKQVGLKEEFRDVAADMMLAMGIRTDLSTRFSKGWLTAEQVKQELIDSGLSPPIQERMYQWIVKNTGTDRVEKERDLTKSEIYKAIKKGQLTPIQGIELIEDMGYDRAEAVLLVEINVGALVGSPESFMEFKRITQLYRQSQGLTAKIPPEELIQAEKDVIADPSEENKLRFHQLFEKWTKEK